MAKRFASLGATVVLWDVNESGNEETKRQIQDAQSDARVFSMKVNLCDREDVYRVAQKVILTNKRSRILIFTSNEFVLGSRSSR